MMVPPSNIPRKEKLMKKSPKPKKGAGYPPKGPVKPMPRKGAVKY